MISIIEHIEYLVVDNDCVVVPGWGAFIAQYNASHTDSTLQYFAKPTRKIGFNGSIHHSDGLLATSMMRKHGISYNEATKLIDENIAVYRQLIQEGTELPFGRLGFFTCGEEGKAEFVPFYHEMSNDAFFGLLNFNFITLANRKEESLVVARQQPALSQETTTLREPASPATIKQDWWLGQRAIQVAASIILLLGLMFVFSTPVIIDNSQQFATMNMAKISSKPVSPCAKATQPNHSTTLPSPKATTPLHQPLPEQPKQAEATIKKEASQHNQLDMATLKNNTGGKYYLVVSTLTSQQQVDTYLASHQDIKKIAKVRVKNNKYRVYIDRSNNYGKLMEKAKTLPQNYSDAWVTID